MTFDLGSHRTIFIQKSRFSIQDCPSIRPEIVLIKIKIDILVLELLDCLLESLGPSSLCGHSTCTRPRGWYTRGRCQRSWLRLSCGRRRLFLSAAGAEKRDEQSHQCHTGR